MIRKAQFIISSTDIRKCPKASKPEFAFIGRSNVGKSSLINALTNHQKLAKVSGKPGKTQTINHFLIDENWYLVDLPGYGWASVSKSLKENFKKMINQYMKYRPNLMVTFVLIDIRHKPQQNDLDFMEWMATNGLPFVIVFTKADKIPVTKTLSYVKKYKKAMSEMWEEFPPYFVTSSETKKGTAELLEYVYELCEQFDSEEALEYEKKLHKAGDQLGHEE